MPNPKTFSELVSDFAKKQKRKETRKAKPKAKKK